MPKDLDFQNIEVARNKHVVPKVLQRYNENKARHIEQVSQTQTLDDLVNFFDSDVQEVIKQHNTPQDRMRVNQMIRLLFDIA